MGNHTGKQTTLFLMICFGVTYLMGILLGCAYFMEFDTRAFASVQMLYPAAAVMIVLLVSRKKEDLPIKFFAKYLMITVVSMLCLLVGVLTKTQEITSVASIIMYGGSIWCLSALWKTELHIKEVFGLSFVNKKKSYFVIGIFIILLVLRQFIYRGIQGDGNIFERDFQTIFIGLVMLLPNFFLTFISFFGEEYGWRYYLQPMLQKKFGNRLGVILLGSLWGIWHLPLEGFYYFSPELTGWGVLNHQMMCIALGVFFAYAYMKTNNIWVPIILHFMNNNFSLFFNMSVTNIELSHWQSVLQSVIPSVIVFLPFIFSKVFSENEKHAELFDKME